MSGQGVGGFLSGGFGATNDWSGVDQTKDQGNFTWGGGNGPDANAYSSQFWQQGQGYMDAGYPTIDQTNISQDYQGGQALAQQQGDWNSYLKQVALGKAGPSAAQLQMQQGTDQAIQAQAAMANSARGGGSTGNLAAYQAAQRGQQLEQQNVQQTGILRAQEQQQAMGQYQQGLAQQRAQQLQQQGLSAQEAIQQANLEMQNRQTSIQGQLGSEALANQAEAAQLHAGESEEQLKQQTSAQNANTNQQNATGIIGTAMMAAGALAALSDEDMKMNVMPIGESSGGSDASFISALQKAGDDSTIGSSAPTDQKSGSGNGGWSGVQSGMGGMLGGIMGGGGGGMMGGLMSDEKSKREIESLRSENEQLRQGGGGANGGWGGIESAVHSTLGPRGRNAPTSMQQSAYDFGRHLGQTYGMGSTGAAYAGAAGAASGGAPPSQAARVGGQLGAGVGVGRSTPAQMAEAYDYVRQLPQPTNQQMSGVAPPPVAAQPQPLSSSMTSAVPYYVGGMGTGAPGTIIPSDENMAAYVRSDEHSKTRIRELERQNAGLQQSLGQLGAEVVRQAAPAADQGAADAGARAAYAPIEQHPPIRVMDYENPAINGYPAGPAPAPRPVLPAATPAPTAEGAQLRGLPPTVASDEDMKMRVKGASVGHDGPIDEMLMNVRPVSYEYKDPRDGVGRQYGIIAQDLEKSPMGDSMVMNTPRGKMVDTRKAALGGLAALSDHHARLERLERAFGMGGK
jgi:hypothetical protein